MFGCFTAEYVTGANVVGNLRLSISEERERMQVEGRERLLHLKKKSEIEEKDLKLINYSALFPPFVLSNCQLCFRL